MSCAKTAEPIEMQFGVLSRDGSREHVRLWFQFCPETLKSPLMNLKCPLLGSPRPMQTPVLGVQAGTFV